MKCSDLIAMFAFATGLVKATVLTYGLLYPSPAPKLAVSEYPSWSVAAVVTNELEEIK